jgi:hypothetical protein
MFCFNALAIQNNDADLCVGGNLYCKLNFIDSPQEQFDYVKNTADSLFNGVKFVRTGFLVDNRSSFVFGSAAITLNAEMCFLLDDVLVDINKNLKAVPLRSACIVKVAYLKDDPSICSKVTTEKERNICQDVLLNGCKENSKYVCERLNQSVFLNGGIPSD